jgi:hypothetical protein
MRAKWLTLNVLPNCIGIGYWGGITILRIHRFLAQL